MAACVGKLHTGLEVLIQRTDGRIHPAKISEIWPETQSACVEWRERNETKGKEILLESILELNPLLRGLDGGNALLLVANRGENGDHLPRKPGAAFSSLSSTTTVAQGERVITRPNNIRRTMVVPLTCRPHSCTSAEQQDKGATVVAAESAGEDARAKLRKSLTSIDELRTGEQGRREVSMKKGGNCLKEIQRIAQNREQRRLEQQNAMLQKQSAMLSDAFVVSHRKESVLDAKRGPDGRNSQYLQGGKKNVEFRLMISRYRKRLEARAKRMSVCPIRDSACTPGRINRRMSQVVDSPMTVRVCDKPADNRITVSVRKRPINGKESIRGELDIVSIFGPNICMIHSPREKVDLTKYLDNHNFSSGCFQSVLTCSTLDLANAFDEYVSTYTVYKHTVRPLVENVIAGNHSMCFAYGQTGSGKTFTMGGDMLENRRIDCSNGIYAFASKDLFQRLDRFHKGQYSLFCSFFEIYCGKVFDLFNRRKRLSVRDDQRGVVQVVDLKQEYVETFDDLMKLIQFGMASRTSGTTSANENSSRSHAVFRITLSGNREGRECGRMSLIDLAGSERGKDTSNSSDKSTMIEGAEINKSLLALKECVRALSNKADHIPFRGSILTRVLRDSFVGPNAMLSMIAMISPSSMNSEHSLNTLRYADRVKELAVHNDYVVQDSRSENEDPRTLSQQPCPQCANIS